MNLTCAHCGKKFSGLQLMHRSPVNSYEILCNECLEGVTDKAKVNWLQTRQLNKTLEERLIWIEEYIYEIESESDKISAEILSTKKDKP